MKLSKKEYFKKYYQEHKEYFRIKQKNYHKNHPGYFQKKHEEWLKNPENRKKYYVAIMKWAKKNPEKIRIYQSTYFSNPDNENKHRESDKQYQRLKRKSGKINKTEESRIYREKYRVRVNANRLVNYYISTGKIKRGKCELKDKFCSNGVVHAHHHDYDKPLDVVWLCPSHHKKVDLGIIKLLINK